MIKRNISVEYDEARRQSIGVISHHHDFIHNYLNQMYMFFYEMYIYYDQMVQKELDIQSYDEEEDEGEEEEEEDEE